MELLINSKAPDELLASLTPHTFFLSCAACLRASLAHDRRNRERKYTSRSHSPAEATKFLAIDLKRGGHAHQ